MQYILSNFFFVFSCFFSKNFKQERSRKGLMTLNLCLKMLPIEIILELVITGNQNIFWVSLQCVAIDLKPTDTFFNPCLVFLSYFLLFLEANIKPTELCITFLVLQAIFVASKCITLLLCCKLVHRKYRSFFQNCKKYCAR